MLEILETDQIFHDSPDSGHPDCICSRCHQPILSTQLAMRIFISEEEEDEDFWSENLPEQETQILEPGEGEIRYCETCQEASGITISPFDPVPESCCRVCGCTDRWACNTPTGACHWVEPDLCSACAYKESEQIIFAPHPKQPTE